MSSHKSEPCKFSKFVSAQRFAISEGPLCCAPRSPQPAARSSINYNNQSRLTAEEEAMRRSRMRKQRERRWKSNQGEQKEELVGRWWWEVWKVGHKSRRQGEFSLPRPNHLNYAFLARYVNWKHNLLNFCISRFKLRCIILNNFYSYFLCCFFLLYSSLSIVW